MIGLDRRAAGPRRGVIVALALLSSGCGRAAPPEAVVVSPGGSWSAIDPAKVVVPGVALHAWRGPEGSSLSISKGIPAPRATARTLRMDLASRLENLPGLNVAKSETATVGGVEAARVEVVAPGTGDVIAPSGMGKPIAPDGETLVPTHRVSVGFARPDGNYWITWHYPESASATLGPEVDSILKSGVAVLDRAASPY